MNSRQQQTIDRRVAMATDKTESTARELTRQMRALAFDLTAYADRLEADPEDATINSLGVVQGRGSEIDRLCGLLRDRRETAAMLGLLREHLIERADAA